MLVTTTNVQGIEEAMYTMRNPMNSWHKSDTCVNEIGINDLKLAKKLIKAGSEHRKFLRSIVVWADISAPLYWWHEFDTYKVGVTKNSCSTMHKIFDRCLEESDFETSTLSGNDGRRLLQYLNTTIEQINDLIMLGRVKKDNSSELLLIKSLLPSSYLQLASICTNYEVLYNVYNQRKNHRLPVWRKFCDWIETLPYFKELFLS